MKLGVNLDDNIIVHLPQSLPVKLVATVTKSQVGNPLPNLYLASGNIAKEIDAADASGGQHL